MTKSPETVEEPRISSNRSLRLVVFLVAVTIAATFAAEFGIMLAMPYILPKGSSEMTEALLDATLISVILGLIILPLLMFYRRRTLRRVGQTEQRRKAIENAFQRQAIQLRNILDNLGEGVFAEDDKGNVTYLNAEGERLIGWRFDEVVGKNLNDIIRRIAAPASPAIADSKVTDALASTQSPGGTTEQTFIHKDGTPFPVSVSGSTLTLDGNQTGSLTVFSDLREEQLLKKRMLDAKNAAETATRLKADFLSTMSHEIRTPLNGVVGMTGLLLDTDLDPEQTEYVHTIKVSADALMSVINDVLDYSKIEAGQMALEHTEFSLREVIETSVELLAAKGQEKSLTMASFMAEDVPDRLVGDPTRIRQVLLNFISNAIKFTPAGEVEVRAECSRASFHATGNGAAVRRIGIRLSVRDSGIGVAEADKGRLFQPFSQADSSTTRKYGGTGLGLSICKRLVDVMEGQIGVDSISGAGATFWVHITLDVAPQSAAGMQGQDDLSGKYVLVAGDSLGCRQMLVESFSAWKMRHESFKTLGQLRQRLAYLKGQNAAPDVVMLVQPLEDATLEEAVKALRLDGVHAVVCCLPHADRVARTSLEQLGAVVMHKPIRQSALLDSLMVSLFRDLTLVPAAHRPASRPQRVASSGGYHLLLAEDNIVNQKVASQILSKLGYQVDVVDNGIKAVAAAASGKYALVLMDCQMPEMDGFEASLAIRRAEGATGARLPIVAITANALQGDRDRCLEMGMDDYISKPIDAVKLAQLLTQWLPRKQPALPTVQALMHQTLPMGSIAPSIDLSYLSDLVDSDEKVLDDLLAAFLTYLRPLQARLERELQSPGPGLKALLHELRGSSSNVGAKALAQVASRMDAALAGSDFAALGSLVEPIENEIARAIDFIGQRAQKRTA